MKAVLGLCALYFAVVSSAVALVYSKHLQRRYFVELQVLESARDQLRTDWERLQLEDSAWSNDARIEQLAVKKLNMKSVDPDDIVMLELSQ